MRVTRALQRGKTRRRRRLGLQKESPALHREASRERDPVSISYTDRIGVVKSRCLRDAHPSLAVCTVNRSPHSIGGSLFGSTASERADRLSTRTSPQVARLGPISEAVVLRADHPLAWGADTPGPVGRRRGIIEGAPTINGPEGIRRKLAWGQPQRRPVLGPQLRMRGRSVWPTITATDKPILKPSNNAARI